MREIRNSTIYPPTFSSMRKEHFILLEVPLISLAKLCAQSFVVRANKGCVKSISLMDENKVRKLQKFLNLLNIQEWKRDSLPKVVAVFAGDLKVLVPFFFNQRAVLDRHGVPHHIFLAI